MGYGGVQVMRGMGYEEFDYKHLYCGLSIRYSWYSDAEMNIWY